MRVKRNKLNFAVILSFLLILMPILSSCSNLVTVSSAKLANEAECAETMVRLPKKIDALEYRHTNSQSTAAWGDPASVIYKCGEEPIGTSSLQCISVNGIDWLVDESQEPIFEFISYGRNPAIVVAIDNNSESKVSSSSVLVALENTVSKIPATKKCQSVNDLNLP